MIFIFCSPLIAQETNDLNRLLNTEKNIQQKQQQLDSLFDILEKKKKDSLYKYYQIAAHWFSSKKDIQHAIVYEEKALKHMLLSKEKDSILIQQSSYTLGAYFLSKRKYKESIKHFQTVVNYNLNTENVNKALFRIGYSYYKIKDFHKADLYYVSLIEELETMPPSSFLADIYTRATTNLIQFNSTDALLKGIEYMKKADSIAKVIDVPLQIKYRIKSRLGSVYNKNQTLNINLSEYYYRQSMQIAKELNDSIKIRNVYLNLGNLYQITDLKKALFYDQKALSLTSKKDSLNRYKITCNISFVHSYFGNYPEGISHAHNALQILTNENFKDHKRNYQDVFLASPYKQNLLTQLSILAQIYLRYYEVSKDPILLEKCISYFKMSDQLIDLLKIDSSEFTSRLFWRNVSNSLYGKAIRACYLKQDIEQAHYFIEKNKALLLMEDLASQAYKRSLTISPDLIIKEQNLQREIIEQEQLLRIRKQSLDTTSTDTLYRTLINKKRTLEQLRNNMLPEKQFSFEPTIVSLQEVQKSIKSDELIINYHISDDDGYGLYSNNNRGYIIISSSEKTDFLEINNTNILEDNIHKLLASLKRPFKTQDDIDNYSVLSNIIFTTLFPSIKTQDQVKDKKLIISPDNYLSFIPFEALSITPDNISYLIQNAEVRYVYSNSFIKNIGRANSTQENTYLAIAPVHFNDNQLNTLEYSLQETNSLNSYYSGDALLEEKGTKKAFLNALNKHGIIHLATHADISDTASPWIAFQDQKITLEELYLTENNASLVFLSGCNTTLGDHKTGEGVMSLARGFFYSGSQSVISTLWSIDDKSTAYITDHFYKNLSKEQTISEALHHAKQSYLQQHSGSEASPYYWASTILLGKNAPILSTKTISYNLYVWMGLFVLLLLSIYYFKYRSQRKRKHEK